MNRIITPMAILALGAAAFAQETKTVTVQVKDGKQTVTVNGKEVKTIPADVNIQTVRGKRTLILDGDGKVKVVYGGDADAHSYRTMVSQGGPKTIEYKIVAGTGEGQAKTITLARQGGTRYNIVAAPANQSKVTLNPHEGVQYGVTTIPAGGHTIAIAPQGGHPNGVVTTLRPGSAQAGPHQGITLTAPRSNGTVSIPPRELILDLDREGGARMAQGDDDAKIRELSRKLAELSRELSELIQKRGGMAPRMELMPKMDMKDMPKLDKKMLELHQKEMGKLKEMPELFEMRGMPEGMKFEMKELDEKDLAKLRQMPKLFKKGEMPEGMKFEFKELDKMGKMAPGEFYFAPGKMDDKEKAEFKRFFDEPMFQTPEPNSKEKSKTKRFYFKSSDSKLSPQIMKEIQRSGKLDQETRKEIEMALKEAEGARGEAMKELRLSQKERGEAMKEAAIAMKAASKEREQAIAQAVKEASGARIEAEAAIRASRGARAAAGQGEIKELRQRIEALEAEIKALREENRKLKQKGSTPPPDVEIKSKRIK